MPLLILDETTLFYHTLSVTLTSKPSGLVKNWAVQVSRAASKSNGPSPIRSIHTAASATLHSNTCLTKSSNVLVTSKIQASKDKTDDGTSPGPGGFVDKDETEERQHALSSPMKGNQRLNSAVSATT
jgi:hypothetical protein